MIKTWFNHKILEFCLDIVTRNMKPRHNYELVGSIDLLNKWNPVLISNVYEPLEPHVQEICSHCLEEQVKLHKGITVSPYNHYVLVQQYSLPLIRRTFGLLSITAVDKLRMYEHDPSRTRHRTQKSYPVIPRESQHDIEKRKRVRKNALEMEAQGYSMDEIVEYMRTNATESELIAERVIEEIHDQLVDYLERSIINDTFKSGILMETNVQSSKWFDCYIG